MFKRSALALVVLILVGGLCAGLVYFNFFRTKMIGQFFANMKAPAVSISTTVVKPSTWKPEIEAIGTLRAAQGVNVSAEAAGTIRSIDFQANDHIEAGQLLVQIDDDVEKAQLGSAQATLERDQSALERAQRLRKTGVTAESNLDDAQMQFAAASSEVERSARPSAARSASRAWMRANTCSPAR
jgi:membrane fusion protein (multidrug efflux system)